MKRLKDSVNRWTMSVRLSNLYNKSLRTGFGWKDPGVSREEAVGRGGRMGIVLSPNTALP